MSKCGRSYEECSRLEHPCFGHKMELWRGTGQNPMHRPDEVFKSTTIGEFQRDMFARAAVNGYEPIPTAEKYRWSY